MSQSVQTAPQPAESNPTQAPRRFAAAVGSVPFCLVLLSAILVLVPGSRVVGLALLLLLAIPTLVVWIRARKLRDGSRGLTTSTATIWTAAFILGCALTPAAPVTSKPDVAAAAPVEQAAPPSAPVEQAAPPSAPQPVVMTPPVPEAQRSPRPSTQVPPSSPAPRTAPAPQVAPAPVRQDATDEPSGAVYYKNCAAARAAGAAPIQRGEPGYRSALDRDDDGTACDS